jgi:hypothetical protein
MCLEALLYMSERWKLAKNCHTVLSDLSEAFQEMEHSEKRPPFNILDSTSNSVHPPSIQHHAVRDPVSSTVNYQSGSRKRARPHSESRPKSSQNSDGFGQPPNQIPTNIVNVSADGPRNHSFLDPFKVTGPTIEDGPHSVGDPGRPSNWESGMPDLLANVTWESLLGGINQDDPTWDNAFF